MKKVTIRFAAQALVLASLATPAFADSGSLNVICGVQAEWCSLVKTEFTKHTGIKVNIVQKSGGEALAQLTAEAANPKADIWFGGSGDPHLQAAENNLTTGQSLRRNSRAIKRLVYIQVRSALPTTRNSSPRRSSSRHSAGRT